MSGDRPQPPPPRGLRFDPPRRALTAEERWVLLRAFAPAGAIWSGPVDGERAIAVAARLGVSSRLTDRSAAERLTAEVGREPAERLAAARWAAVAKGLQVAETARTVARAAADHAAPLVLLKGAALHQAGVADPGSRPAADVDALAPAQVAEEIHTALADPQGVFGFTADPAPANEQHLPPLTSPQLCAVDLHFRLRGVTLGSDWAVAEELLEAGLCRPLAGLPGECFVPTPQLAAAHTVAHGIEQHSLRPDTYPLARMLGDLIDLAAAAGSRSVATLIAAGAPWLAQSVSTEELAATARLADRLAAGELPPPPGEGAGGGEGDDPTEAGAGRLLAHLIAAQDPEYAASLRFDHLLDRVGSAHRRGELRPYLARKLNPSPSGRGVRYSLARIARVLGGAASRLWPRKHPRDGGERGTSR